MALTSEHIEISSGRTWTEITNTTFSFSLQNTLDVRLEYSFVNDPTIKRGAFLNISDTIPNLQQSIFIRAYDIDQNGTVAVIRYDVEENLTPSFGSLMNVKVQDGFGNPIGSLGGALNTHDADVHNIVINRYVHQDTAITTTLTTAVVGDGTEYTINVLDATGFLAGDRIHLNTTSVENTHPIITNISNPTGASTFTLDRRLDKTHLVGDSIYKAITDMASQTATQLAPQSYRVYPQVGEVWHIKTLLFTMTHDSAGSLDLFGNLGKLTNGVILRAKVNGQYGTFTNWKTNSDIKDDMSEVKFDSRSLGGTLYGTTGIGQFENAGAVIRLDGTTGDYIEVMIQDNITGLNRFTMKVQGHAEA